ncbi:MAG: malto-oligosyltrehalose synthase [Longimicrobiales bacterium]
MRVPHATYRLQLNAEFRLADVHQLLDYFQALGISDLYLSPLLQARSGSTHGYDVIDPGHVNHEIGSDAEFEQLAAALSQRGMGLLLDIVPNHMSATEANPWWRAVLEHGRAARFARFFDIDWTAQPKERLALPVLNKSLEACTADGDLRVVIEDRQIALAYLDRRLPLDAASIPLLVSALQANFGPQLPAATVAELDRLAERAAGLPARTDTEHAEQRAQSARLLHNGLADALSNGPCRHTLPLEREQLMELLDRQPYTLFHWLPGDRQINYRRFFDISELAGLRSEDPAVFAATHERILPWLRTGTITGVRIDHIDGLRDPAGYLRTLHQAIAQNTDTRRYVVVEKILIGDEQVPTDWCANGTTGYDFLGVLNGLFVQPDGWQLLTEAYSRLTGIADFTELLHVKKHQVIATLFRGELHGLVLRLSRLLPHAAHEALEFALTEITACLPVYRTYITCAPHEVDYAVIDEALNGARQRGADAAVIDWLRDLLLEPQSDDRLEFTLRWQQLSGPVMAKGLEDTTFYNYHPLVSTCDVGCDPRRAICSIARFHERMQSRLSDWPHSLNATSTHDNKRSEDVRARINVLSELAGEWLSCVQQWRTLHAPLRRQVQDLEAPDANTELLLYQTLIGVWPLQPLTADFEQRIRTYMLKAVREAKQRTSWRAPNEEYEAVVLGFVSSILNGSEFRVPFLQLEQRTSFYGALNSLAQVVLKLGAPGVPDFYQGTESWSLSLVDPDNRRPVDYAERRIALQPVDLETAKRNWRDGRIKALVTARGLHERARCAALFASGQYVPIKAVGEREHHIIAFERRLGNQRVLFVAARFLAQLRSAPRWPDARTWGDTELLTEAAEWQDVITGRSLVSRGPARLATLLSDLPVAILTATA